MKRLKMLVFFLYFFGFSVSDIASVLEENDEGCYTPDKKLGQCIEVRECLGNTMQQKHLSTEAADYLKKSHCGFEGTQPKICCPLNNPAKMGYRPSSSEKFSEILPDTSICGLQEYNMFHDSTQASIKEFPWLALLQYEKPHGHEFNCGGTLINKRYILTSAHCVARTPESWKLVNVRLGEHNLNSSIDCRNDPHHKNLQQCADAPINIRVAEKIIHEHYNPDDFTQLNDIALLRLNKDVVFTEFVRPICLPKPGELLNDGNSDGKMTVAGWGLFSETRSHSNVKLKSRVPLQSYSECTAAYDRIHVNLHGQLCTTEGHDFCIVDSGGPLMVHNSTNSGFNWYITGVKSFGPTPCGNNNWPDVYTRVNKYVDWIVSHIRP